MNSPILERLVHVILYFLLKKLILYNQEIEDLLLLFWVAIKIFAKQISLNCSEHN